MRKLAIWPARQGGGAKRNIDRQTAEPSQLCLQTGIVRVLVFGNEVG
jgi:hypothetical protein